MEVGHFNCVFLPCYLLCFLLYRPNFAVAELIQIDGPIGPLSGELLTATSARYRRDHSRVWADGSGWKLGPDGLAVEYLKAPRGGFEGGWDIVFAHRQKGLLR